VKGIWFFQESMDLLMTPLYYLSIGLSPFRRQKMEL